MNVLYVTNMYPSDKHIYQGIHVKEQIDHLNKRYGVEHEIYYINGVNSKFNYLKSIFLINKLLKVKSFDLIHIHFGLSGIFLLFNPFLKIPTVVTIHGSDIGTPKEVGLIQYITIAVIKRVYRAIILNDNMIALLNKQKHKLIKIPCGININHFDVKRNNIKPSFVIGFPGDKTRKEKNYPLFEEIVNSLISSGYNIQVVEFHKLTRTEVAESLSKLDCLLMTSHREGSPQIIKEAMVCEVPIISSNVGDVSMLLEGVDNCYVINTFSANAFIGNIVKLINLDPMQRRTNGKKKIRLLKLDQDSVCLKIFNLYESVINRRYKSKS